MVGKSPLPHNNPDCKCFRCTRIPHNKGIPWMKGHKFKKEEVAGDKNVNWKGGKKYSLYVSERKSVKFRQWRKEVLIRDGFKCALCQKTGGELHAHHIKTFYLHIEIRFDVNNGITLCKDCHFSVNNKEQEYEEKFYQILKSSTN